MPQKPGIRFIARKDPDEILIHEYLLKTKAGLSATTIDCLNAHYLPIANIEQAIATGQIDRQAINLQVVKSIAALTNQINTIAQLAGLVGIEVDRKLPSFIPIDVKQQENRVSEDDDDDDNDDYYDPQEDFKIVFDD